MLNLLKGALLALALSAGLSARGAYYDHEVTDGAATFHDTLREGDENHSYVHQRTYKVTVLEGESVPVTVTLSSPKLVNCQGGYSNVYLNNKLCKPTGGKCTFTVTSDATVLVQAWAGTPDTYESGREASTYYCEVSYTIQATFPPRHTVRYRPGSGGVTGDETLAKYPSGKSVVLGGEIYCRLGYRQRGWATADQGAKRYSLGETVTMDADYELYPYWEQVPVYTIRYLPGSDATGTERETKKTQGLAVALLKTSPFARTGYVQTGWTREEGGAMAFGLGAQYATDEDVTLYPYWASDTVTVTFKPGVKGVGGTMVEYKQAGTSLLLHGPIYSRKGYRQCGWTDVDGGEKRYDLYRFYSLQEPKTLYPVWEPDPAADKTYMVVDISGGPDVANYPVSYLSEVPEGGWTDEYKTCKIVLRRIQVYGVGALAAGLSGPDGRSRSDPYYIGVFEMTQKQYALIVGEGSLVSSDPVGDTMPVHDVTMRTIHSVRQKMVQSGDYYDNYERVDDDGVFGKLRTKTGIQTFDLPSSAMFDYAAAGGVENHGWSVWHDDRTGEFVDSIRDMAFYTETNPENLACTAVGRFKPCVWGIYDAYGNTDEMTTTYGFGGYNGKIRLQSVLGGNGISSEADCWKVQKMEAATYKCGFRLCCYGSQVTAQTYEITYLPGEYGTGDRQEDAKIEGLGVELRGPLFSRSGYVQSGWRDDDGRTYGFGILYETDASLTLYPVWRQETAKPSAPVVSSVSTDDAARVTVTWGEVSGAATYAVYRSTTSSRPSSAIATGISAVTWSDTTASPGVTYRYWVQAVNDAGASDVGGSASGYRRVALATGAASHDFTAAGGEASVSVTANTDWTAVKSAAWITLANASGSGDGTLRFSAAANGETAERSGTITVTAGAGTDHPVQTILLVRQAAKAVTTIPVPNALDNTTLAFSTGGGASWLGQTAFSHDGADAARSGAISHNQTSWLSTTVVGPGEISFWWYASSESKSYDYLFFGVDGTETDRIGGTALSWTKCTCRVPAGSHELKWTYRKDGSISSGEDAGFVDEVVWTPDAILTPPSLDGDPDATVAGDPQNGYVITPSAGRDVDVVVTVPSGLDPERITVVLPVSCRTVRANGAKVRIARTHKAQTLDMTDWLELPSADAQGVVDLTRAAVRDAVVRETMSPQNGAILKLDADAPSITTGPTRPGLVYFLREGRTVGGMRTVQATVGDGNPWTPDIGVKGGASAFYSIGVSKDEVALEEPESEGLYCVIDISGGTSAASYPVSYLDDVPSGGWTDEYKQTKIVLRRIQPGSFVMGLRSTDYPGAEDRNLHEVTLTAGYYVGVFEVTQRQWELVTGSRPSYFSLDSCYAMRPVEKVSYDDIRGASSGATWPASSQVDADSFIGRLRAKAGLPRIDLPTEAEWEYACRAGTTTALSSGVNLSDAKEDAAMSAVGRYSMNGGGYAYSSVGLSGGTAEVGTYLPNPWGLYDMHGNVGEWCLDYFAATVSTSQTTDPVGPQSGNERVLKGGGFGYVAGGCCSGRRDAYSSGTRYNTCGLRIAVR